MLGVPSCVLKLSQLVDLKVMTKQQSMDIVQLASWPNLRCLEVGVMLHYKPENAIAVANNGQPVLKRFTCHASALKEAFMETKPEAAIHVYPCEVNEGFWDNLPAVMQQVMPNSRERHWVMKVLI